MIEFNDFRPRSLEKPIIQDYRELLLEVDTKTNENSIKLGYVAYLDYCSFKNIPCDWDILDDTEKECWVNLVFNVVASYKSSQI